MKNLLHWMEVRDRAKKLNALFSSVFIAEQFVKGFGEEVRVHVYRHAALLLSDNGQ